MEHLWFCIGSEISAYLSETNMKVCRPDKITISSDIIPYKVHFLLLFYISVLNKFNATIFLLSFCADIIYCESCAVVIHIKFQLKYD